jgi:hypothetical protein
VVQKYGNNRRDIPVDFGGDDVQNGQGFGNLAVAISECKSVDGSRPVLEAGA